MRNVLFFILLVFGAGVGGIWLQVFLSKMDSKWPGLALPMISLLISLVAVFGIAAYTVTPDTSLTDGDGAVTAQPAPESARHAVQDVPALLFTVGGVFLLYNIPTVVLLAVYFGCRERQRQQKAIEKMRVQDLE